MWSAGEKAIPEYFSFPSFNSIMRKKHLYSQNEWLAAYFAQKLLAEKFPRNFNVAYPWVNAAMITY